MRCVVGYGRTGAIQDHHDGVLSRSHGDPTRLRRDRRALFQQCVHLIPFSSLLWIELIAVSVDIRTWHSNVEQHASEGVNKVLIGNKCDWTDKKVPPLLLSFPSILKHISGRDGTARTRTGRRVGTKVPRDFSKDEHQRRRSLLRPRPVRPLSLLLNSSLKRPLPPLFCSQTRDIKARLIDSVPADATASRTSAGGVNVGANSKAANGSCC